MRKPIFAKKWWDGKKPSLQIKILKIVLEDHVSKRKATDILHSNYPDVSDAMDALADERKFIEFSHKNGTRMPEKFYKITEKGLRALLAVPEDLFEREFWKVILLLCIESEPQISHSEFNEYYEQFQKKRMGYSAIDKYFFQSSFFDNILDKWLQNEFSTNYNSSVVSIPQKVMECLSLNHSITLQQLAEKISTNEEDLAKVLNNYTLQDDTHSNVLPTESEFDNLDMQKKVYFEFIRRALIIAHRTNTGITYELSLFGIMLTMAFIRYHYARIDSIRYPNLVDDHDLDISRSALFYKDITQEEYYDNIAHNYQDKLPLIFAKWDFLKEQLGTTLLYTSFDFMIYKKIPSNSTLQSIWIGGNKEFYEDLKSLADNARYYLLIVYLAGITTLQSLQQYQEIINDSRINPIYRKLAEIEEILKYIDIESFVYQLRGKNRTKSLSSLIKIPNQKSSNMDKVQTIENIFIEELTFLFYLNLNNTVFPPSRSYRTDPSGKSNKLDCAMINEVNRLGSPRHCLMAILSKNNDIKQWFSDRISDVTSYRSQTLDKMSKFYNEVINSHQHIRVIPEQQDLTNI